jgi:hypothetical protein
VVISSDVSEGEVVESGAMDCGVSVCPRLTTVVEVTG